MQKHGELGMVSVIAGSFSDTADTCTAVSYLNLDVSVAGTNFHGSASPSLALLLKSTAEQIEHPSDESRSLWSMKDGGDWKEFNALQDEVDFEELFASGTGVSALGSGSDYTAFLQRYGVASTDMGYGGGPRDPPYHYHRYVDRISTSWMLNKVSFLGSICSIYDSYTWQKTYADPGFHKHVSRLESLLVTPTDSSLATHRLQLLKCSVS